MKTTTITKVFSGFRGIVAAALALGALAGAGESWAITDAEYRAWQLERALHPSARQLERERAGKVYIYDGLTTADIDRILEEAFDRVESMMFVNVVVADENGEPLQDPVTGELVALDDGC